MFDRKIIKAPALDDSTFRVDAPPLPEFKPFVFQTLPPKSGKKKSPEQEEGSRITQSGNLEAAAAMEAGDSIKIESIMAEAQKAAAGLLEEARSEVQAIKADLENTCGELRKKAYDTGYEEGYKEGSEQAEEEYSAKIQEAESIRGEAIALREQAQAEGELIRSEAEQERTRRILESEDEILKLAIEIAEKIIRKQISRSGDNWIEVVKEAVKKVAGATEVTIRVSIEDEAYLIQHLSEVQKLLTESPTIRVVADSSLVPGDLIIQSNLGQLDARIKQQLAVMLKSLREEAVG